MIDLKLNKKRLRIHWHYYAWRYALVLVAAMMAANLLFTFTTPKAPFEKRLDVTIVSASFNSTDTDGWENDILRRLPPDQLESSVVATTLIQNEESTIYQLIMARLAAGEGNIWILPKDMFQGFAQSGSFLALEDRLADFKIPQGTNLSLGTVKVKENQEDSGVKHICGIPLDKCPGLAEVFAPKGMIMAFPLYTTTNMENTVDIANWLLSKTGEPQPSASIKELVSIPILAHSFKAANTDAWRPELLKALGNGIPAVSIPLQQYAVGRESYSAGLIAAGIKKGEGTAWIVPESIFLELARAGVLRVLDDDVASFGVPAGTDMAPGRAAAMQNGKPGEERQYGIPLDQCLSLDKVTVPEGMLLVFPSWKKEDFNYDAAKKAAQWLIATDLAPEKPAGEAK